MSIESRDLLAPIWISHSQILFNSLVLWSELNYPMRDQILQMNSFSFILLDNNYNIHNPIYQYLLFIAPGLKVSYPLKGATSSSWPSCICVVHIVMGTVHFATKQHTNNALKHISTKLQLGFLMVVNTDCSFETDNVDFSVDKRFLKQC